MIAAFGLLIGALLPAAAQPPSSSAAAGQTQVRPAPVSRVQVARNRQEWQQSMARLPALRTGCYRAAYPRVEWQALTCVIVPNIPYPPAAGAHPYTVGNGVDYSAGVTGLMSGATGSFEAGSVVTGESGINPITNATTSNTYSLQLNTSFMPGSLCTAPTPSPNANCVVWQQFLYSTSLQGVFMQYWLIHWDQGCPAGWTAYPTANANPSPYCYHTSVATPVNPTPVLSDLLRLTLTSTAAAGGNDVTRLDLTPAVGTPVSYVRSEPDSIINLASIWTIAEFVLVGDCCGTQANFSPGSTLVVRTTVHNGTTNAPNCIGTGYTGETNSLTFVGAPAITLTPSPSINTTQSNTAGTPASCAAAQGIGDTHLTTFGGLHYDFQASGDFLLAQAGPDFIVQTRQASGAPNWPNAAVNKQVAVRVGRTVVALCVGERPFYLNGRPADLPDGRRLDLPGGGDVLRTGNVYLIRGPNGDWARVEVNPSWINVEVGLGRWPTQVRGLLASAPNNNNAIVARDGTVIAMPVSFDALYRRFGDSWRVSGDESILCDCGPRIQPGNPARTFVARDLDPRIARPARAICVAARVREGPLLDDCILDVAVIGDRRAAAVFARTPPPRAVGQIGDWHSQPALPGQPTH